MNWNKKLLCLPLLFFTIMAQAQNGPRERVKTLKVAFLTERLSLTSQEAQSFWPIYNEHEERIETFRRKERRQLAGRMMDAPDLSDQEAEKLLDELMTLHAEKLEANTQYLNKVRQVLSAKKTLLLIKAEEDFRKSLLQQFRKKRGGG
ncbi:Spy/CpxP family protein refolding chaperone [Allomuricauda sp. SCSIO 65647]|uniref:Spy/CpxP family protein refolding chaperone n=1 Tax=Allomuricauda sp. SCSIO 65647 TaxID=2908843 RepID=UPI001F1B9E11|nr:hypothetical protein [Muricauda sp. SCSIO 65647]UJH67706.1 hypothetical protein L0P89_00460 [Muricauda sp. SCSIO 65647]